MAHALTFQPFAATEAQYRALADFHNAYYPDHLYAWDEMRYDDRAREASYAFRRYTLREGDRVVGFCSHSRQPAAAGGLRVRLAMCLSPQHLDRRYAAAALDFLLETVAPLEPAELVCSSREDKARRNAFYESRGFERSMRMRRSMLDLQAFDAAPFAPLHARLESEGIEFVPVPAMAGRDPDWIAGWRDLDWELIQDIPATAPPVRESLEHYESLLTDPAYYPESCFFALHARRMIGLTFLWRTRIDPRYVYTGTTGVRRGCRRRGIATALKVKSIEVARAHGHQFLETSNEENNPMYQINVRLGFQPAPAWLEYRKVMATPE